MTQQTYQRLLADTKKRHPPRRKKRVLKPGHKKLGRPVGSRNPPHKLKAFRESERQRLRDIINANFKFYENTVHPY